MKIILTISLIIFALTYVSSSPITESQVEENNVETTLIVIGTQLEKSSHIATTVAALFLGSVLPSVALNLSSNKTYRTTDNLYLLFGCLKILSHSFNRQNKFNNRLQYITNIIKKYKDEILQHNNNSIHYDLSYIVYFSTACRC